MYECLPQGNKPLVHHTGKQYRVNFATLISVFGMLNLYRINFIPFFYKMTFPLYNLHYANNINYVNYVWLTSESGTAKRRNIFDEKSINADCLKCLWHSIRCSVWSLLWKFGEFHALSGKQYLAHNSQLKQDLLIRLYGLKDPMFFSELMVNCFRIC